MNKLLNRNSILLSLSLSLAAVLAAGLAPAKSEKSPADLEGKSAPALSFRTVDAKTFALRPLRGSVVLMDYWATWCPPCRESLPHIQELASDAGLAAQGLKVVAINDMENAPTVKAFLKENKYTFAVPLDSHGDFGKAFNVSGIPTTVIVGRNGFVAKTFVGYGPSSAADIKKTIEDELAKTYTPPAAKSPATKSPATKPAAK